MIAQSFLFLLPSVTSLENDFFTFMPSANAPCEILFCPRFPQNAYLNDFFIRGAIPIWTRLAGNTPSHTYRNAPSQFLSYHLEGWQCCTRLWVVIDCYWWIFPKVRSVRFHPLPHVSFLKFLASGRTTWKLQGKKSYDSLFCSGKKKHAYTQAL